ncbi:MAG: hypothetical protein HYZ00_13900, partial [Candidatus Hydrogenedentes bacterium]|nr:hypothetical protein [Candidatus Hydrogenedentota bacterium]
MIARMDRVEVVFLRPELQGLVAFLQEQGVMHVETVPLAMEKFPGFLHRVHLPAEERAELTDLQQLQTMLRESLPLLSQQPAHIAIVEAGQRLEREGLDAWRDNIRAWHRSLRSLSRRKLNVQDNIELLRNYKRIVQNVSPILEERKLQLGGNVRILVLQGQTPETIRDLEKRLINEISTQCELIQKPHSRNEVVVILHYPEVQAEAVSAFLKRAEITTVDVPDQEIRDKSPHEIIAKIDHKVDGYLADLDKIVAELQETTAQVGGNQAAAEQMVSTRIAQIGVVEHLAQSQMIGVVQGWIPSEEYARVAALIEQRFGARAAVAKMPQEAIEATRVPTLLKNPKLLQPFEIILKLFQPPTYGHFDPTGLVAFSFILFYGFIMGDAGYALIIGGVAWWAKTKWAHVAFVRDAMTIAVWMAVSSFVFGVLYGEFFGNLPELLLGIEDPPFHRAHKTTALLGIAIFVGVIHVPLALVLGIREDFKHHHTKHGFEKLAMLLGLTALGVALGSGYAGLSAGYAIALVLFAVALVFFVKGMGIMAPLGVMEILSLTSNVLSYARLMALGVASFALADIANSLPEMLGLFFGTL